ncbi:hypothetical protein B7990_00285 [Fibrobacter sp. UWB4]|nr:hypothetical protein B7990_00285 [Fibrobacter sp. UWB4]
MVLKKRVDHAHLSGSYNQVKTKKLPHPKKQYQQYETKLQVNHVQDIIRYQAKLQDFPVHDQNIMKNNSQT